MDIRILVQLFLFQPKNRTWYFMDWRKPHRSIWICNFISLKIWRSQWRFLSFQSHQVSQNFSRSFKLSYNSYSNLFSKSIWQCEVWNKYLSSSFLSHQKLIRLSLHSYQVFIKLLLRFQFIKFFYQCNSLVFVTEVISDYPSSWFYQSTFRFFMLVSHES